MLAMLFGILLGAKGIEVNGLSTSCFGRKSILEFFDVRTIFAASIEQDNCLSTPFLDFP